LVFCAARNESYAIRILSTGTWIEVLDSTIADSEEVIDSGLHGPRSARTRRIDPRFETLGNQDGVNRIDQLLDQCCNWRALLVPNYTAVVGNIAVWPPRGAVIPKIGAF